MAASVSKDKKPVFEEEWPLMRPTVWKLLRQEPFCMDKWHALFRSVKELCLWDEKSHDKMCEALQDDILDFTQEVQTRVLTHEEDQSLLRAYISVWQNFFTSFSYLLMPFSELDRALKGKMHISVRKKAKKPQQGSLLRKLMLDSWTKSIFYNIKNRLQEIAMKLMNSERNGESVDSQLFMGLRESYVNLCFNSDDNLVLYTENFEKAYIDSTKAYYRLKAPQYLENNGVRNYMRYAESKLHEEEQRAIKYLMSCSIDTVKRCCVNVLVIALKERIQAECSSMMKQSETQELKIMYQLTGRVSNGFLPMLKCFEEHIIHVGLADMMLSAELITRNPEKYVERLLTLFNQYTVLVEEAFDDDQRLTFFSHHFYFIQIAVGFFFFF